jgi:uncharacterized protein DUF3854
MSLHPSHEADLQSSGLSADTINIMQAYSLSPRELLKFVKSEKVESALGFPYFDNEGKKNDFMRIKIFPALTDDKGHTVKYLQKEKTKPHLYVLPPIIPMLKDTTVPIYVTEGEKKTAKAVESGLCSIGVGGLWNWLEKGSTYAIEDFKSIFWWRRRVVIVPDSDAWNPDRKNLQLAVYALSKYLRSRGADPVEFKRLG